jgi:hypothetical protein
MITYSLIQGGYEIFVDGAKVIHQPHSPTRGVNVKLTEQEAEGVAKLICAKLEQGVDPTVLAEEEQEIINGATDERINELAISYAEQVRQRKQEQDDLQQRITDLEFALAAMLGGAM